jgi:hypothetical protein
MSRRRAILATLPLVALLAAAGCGGSSGHHKTTAKSAGVDCGSITTAAGTHAELKVTKGSVACPQAVSVYKTYFGDLAKGDAPGQGGGGTVNVQGWNCDSYSTPQMQSTGQGGYCSKAGTTVTAFMSPPPTAP